VADHFYSVVATDGRMKRNVTVGTSTSAATPIELRILDGQSVKKRDIYLALESFRDYFLTIDTPA
jgi:hypothetical protein